MFTIITGNDAHYLHVARFFAQDANWVHGLAACTALVEITVNSPQAEGPRYEFRSFGQHDGGSEWEVITLEQLQARRDSLGVEVTDKTLGKGVFVAEWSQSARMVHQACARAIQQMQGLLVLGIFDLPETK